MPSEETVSRRLSDLAMRAADLIISSFLLLFLVVPMAIIALAILIDDGRPVLFLQTRIGRQCRPFRIYKFRTMRNDPARASGELTQTSDLASARAAFQTATRTDRRITRTGRILRSAHLDELPQFFNVLKGDMSLVGVRPDVPVQEADYTPKDWQRRHVLRPGITGLAQVEPGPPGVPGARTKKDLEWVRTRSFSGYLSILFRTFRNVLRRKGI